MVTVLFERVYIAKFFFALKFLCKSPVGPKKAKATKKPNVCMGSGIFKPVKYWMRELRVGNIGYNLERI